MNAQIKEELTDVFLEENYKVVKGRRGIKGMIEWWVVLKTDSLGKLLVINTKENYDEIIINGESIPRRKK